MSSAWMRQARLAVVMAASVLAMVGCSTSGSDNLAHVARMAAEKESARAKQLLADTQFVSAVANAMEKIVARDQRFDSDMEGTTGRLLPGGDTASGFGEAITSQSSRDGGYVTSSVPWRNDDGQLEFYVEIAPYVQREPEVLTTRYVDTSYRHGEFEGFKTSYGPLDNHGLGAGWQGFRATNLYDGGGTLTIQFYTDVGDSDVLGRPWANDVSQRPEARQDIVLDDLPSLPAGQDWRSISLPPEGLAGSLNGAEGRFTCLSGAECSLDNERLLPNWQGYHPGYDSSNHVIFTPADGGMPVRLSGSGSQAVPPGDYLSFGNWLYVPVDVTNTDAFEIGVFAAGRDPFAETNLMALSGTATYTGKAAGIYSAAARPISQSFHADVELTADFGTDSEFGTVDGRVSDFVLDSGAPAALRELRLLAASWRDAQGTSNVFPSQDTDGPALPGGWIEGYTAADGGWWGIWGGRFFGNGVTSTDIPASYVEHPRSFAGTFGATDGNRSFAGSFGAHKTSR